MANTNVALGKLGIWSMEARFADAGLAAEAAAELDELGFGALWVPGGFGGDITGDVDRLLAATRRIALATGIINIWKHEPAEIADWWKSLPMASQSRLMLGVGISHGPVIGEAWGKPIEKMWGYIAELTALGVPSEHLCVAALGPRMVELSGRTTAGAHPYLVTPEHTAQARAILGPDKLLAPEQGVILEADPARARELALGALKVYRELPNYRNSWLRLGFTEDDIAQTSDRLVDGLFAWGPMARIVERVQAHWQAGADHVCLQVITATPLDLSSARAAWRELAAALL